MQRDGSTLARAHLCFVFMLSLMLQPAARKSFSSDATHQVKNLLDQTSHLNEMDCRLYTPSVPAFEKCPNAAMNCFIDEFNVLVEEWGIPFPMNSRRLIKTLKGLRRQFTKPESDCHQCELFNKKNATVFLQDLLQTLIMLNNENFPMKQKRAPPVSSS